MYLTSSMGLLLIPDFYMISTCMLLLSSFSLSSHHFIPQFPRSVWIAFHENLRLIYLSILFLVFASSLYFFDPFLSSRFPSLFILSLPPPSIFIYFQ